MPATGYLAGGATQNMRTVTASATAAIGDYVMVNAAAGAVSITAPTPAAGRIFSIEKIDATANIVTVTGSTFDGSTSVQFVAQNAGATFIGTGTGFRLKAITVNTAGPQGATGLTDQVGVPLLGFEPLPRLLGQGPANVGRGVAALVIGRCTRSATVARLRCTPRTGSSGATLARMAIFTLPDDYGDTGTGSATLAARTANVPAMMSSGYNDVSQALSTTGGYPASFAYTAGKWYAHGLLVVGGSVDPQYFGVSGWGGINGLTPAMAQQYGSQTDFLTTYAISSANAYIDMPWIGSTA